MVDPTSNRQDARRTWTRPGMAMCAAWTATTIAVVVAALTIQSSRIRRHDADLARREQAVMEMKQLVDQIKTSNDEREKRLHRVADNLESMYEMMRSQVPPRAPVEDAGVLRAEHELAPLPPPAP